MSFKKWWTSKNATSHDRFWANGGEEEDAKVFAELVWNAAQMELFHLELPVKNSENTMISLGSKLAEHAIMEENTTKQYIGTKIINAEPINLGEYNHFRGWRIPKDENPADAGMKVVYKDGYTSWSPQKVFDEAYREIDEMTFGLAIEAMKKGWNGKGIYIFLVDEASGFKRVGFNGENCDVKLQQHIAIDTTGLQTKNDFAPKSVVPWLPSQTDMLAEDWEMVK